MWKGTRPQRWVAGHDRPARRSCLGEGGVYGHSGLVLPVGGIKEKVLAAHRAGIRRIILPKANEKDLREVPEEVREEVQCLFVESIEEVLRLAFQSREAQGNGAPRAGHLFQLSELESVL